MAIANDIAEDLVTILNQATLSQPFTAERSKRPSYDLKELGTSLKVVVTSRATETEKANRHALHEDHLTEIAIIKQLDSAENADTDPMDDLVQEIADELKFAALPIAPAAFFNLAYETQTDEDELNENCLFFALISVVHRATR